MKKLALAVVLVVAGCNGTVGEGEEVDTGAAYEPDEEEGRQVFTTGLGPGTEAEVCKTGGDGLNLRRGAGKGYGVITVMSEGNR
jgi:predicted small secreted protein